MECKVWSAQCGVYSGECKVWSVQCGVKSVSFPQRYCEARDKPETQYYTRGNLKTSISCETSSNFDTSTTSKSRGFAASPIDTAKPLKSQKLKITHVGA